MATREESGVSGKIDFNDGRYELVAKDDNTVKLVDKIQKKDYIIKSGDLEYNFRKSGKKLDGKAKIDSSNQLILSFDFWESASGHAETSSGSKFVLQKSGSILYHKYSSQFEVFRSSRCNSEEENYIMSVSDFIDLVKANATKE